MIECDKTLINSVKTFDTDRQFYDMHEFFSCYWYIVIFCIYIILLDIFQKSKYVNVHRLHEIK
jgi:hypothetical protein